MSLACTDKTGLLDHLFDTLSRGIGGWLVTANLDFLRRYAHDAEIRALYARADLRVVDGMPLMWAARIQGDRFPERLAGADLIWLIAERAARENRSIYLLGGDPVANTKAAAALCERWPALVICGHSSPMVGSPPSVEETVALREEMLRTRPDIVFVGMGSPKQEHVIRALRTALPGSWMAGVGASFSFAAGEIRRAPGWMQRSGFEWLWRLGQEPKRLARRYLLEDLPFFFELIGGAVVQRARRGPGPRQG
jgi:N-acetylglucosaminyldiphosphoundecaprenol N-acetyl-beta-D-mannosaminyltransferase